MTNAPTSFSEARALLPSDATFSSCFGLPGQGGYVEYWRRPNGERWTISNGHYDSGHDWQCQRDAYVEGQHGVLTTHTHMLDV